MLFSTLASNAQMCSNGDSGGVTITRLKKDVPKGVQITLQNNSDHIDFVDWKANDKSAVLVFKTKDKTKNWCEIEGATTGSCFVITTTSKKKIYVHKNYAVGTLENDTISLPIRNDRVYIVDIHLFLLLAQCCRGTVFSRPSTLAYP